MKKKKTVRTTIRLEKPVKELVKQVKTMVQAQNSHHISENALINIAVQDFCLLVIKELRQET